MTRIAVASFSGTAIEFYDFFVYGTAAALVLGPLFFPEFSDLAGTLAAFATYAVGFVARPLGSVLFGHVGDRYGRRPVLVFSLMLTGVATVLVGLLPTYGTIGIAAPLLLVLLRFLQGLGLGGEWGGAVLLATEHAPPGRRGLWASFPQTGPSVGFLLANGVMLTLTANLSDAQFESWGWRVPFWFAGVLAAVGLLLRTSMEETPEFKELQLQDRKAELPLAEVVRTHWKLMLLAAGGLMAGYATFYTATTWALHHATENLGVTRTTILWCVMVAVLVKGVSTPVMALAGDRFGRRPLCLLGSAAMGLWAFPMLWLLQSADPLLMTVGLVGSLVAFITMFAVVGAYLPELFPSRVRCTGASTAYNLGGVLGGALTPIIATAISDDADGTPWGVGLWIAGLAVVSVLCFRALPETRPVAPWVSEAAIPHGRGWRRRGLAAYADGRQHDAMTTVPDNFGRMADEPVLARYRRARNLATAKRAFAAVSEGDLGAQLASYTDDIVLEFPYAEPPVRVQGKAEVKAYLTRALGVFSLRLTMTTFHECVEPDTLIVEFTSEGEVATTGRTYENTYISVLRFNDGLICEQKEFYNPVPAKDALTP